MRIACTDVLREANRLDYVPVMPLVEWMALPDKSDYIRSIESMHNTVMRAMELPPDVFRGK